MPNLLKLLVSLLCHDHDGNAERDQGDDDHGTQRACDVVVPRIKAEEEHKGCGRGDAEAHARRDLHGAPYLMVEEAVRLLDSDRDWLPFDFAYCRHVWGSAAGAYALAACILWPEVVAEKIVTAYVKQVREL